MTTPVPAEGAEERVLLACVVCGVPVAHPPKEKAPPTCNPTHARIAKEAAEGRSQSAVMLGHMNGGPGRLVFRTYGVPEVERVRMIAIETPGDGSVNTLGGTLTPREARLFAAALLRAARRAEGKTANPTLEA